MRRTILLVVFALHGLISSSFATDLRFKQEFGRSSQALVLEEEEDDDRFSFWKASMGLTQGDEKAKFHLDAFRYEKDYKARLTDFETTRVEADAWRRLSWKGDEFRGGFFGSWRSRELDRFSLQNFKEFRFGAYAEDWRDWGARASASFYDYESDRSESRFSGRLNRKFEWQEWQFKPYVMGERHQASSRRKFKGEAGGSAAWEPGFTHWERAALRLEAGQRDTKMLEEREDDVDYTFWDLKLQSRHPLKEGQTVRWEAGLREKEDKGGLFSHRGASIEGGHQFRLPYGQKDRITLEPFLGFKRMKFTESPNFTYEKSSLGALASMLSWDDWKVTAEGKIDFYTYTFQNTHKQRGTAKLSLEKELSDTAGARVGGILRNSTLSIEASLSLKL